MKIIHILGTLNTGGVQKFIYQLINTPILSNYQHIILSTIKAEGNFRYQFEKRNIEIDYFPFTYLPKTSVPFKVDKFFRSV